MDDTTHEYTQQEPLHIKFEPHFVFVYEDDLKENAYGYDAAYSNSEQAYDPLKTTNVSSNHIAIKEECTTQQDLKDEPNYEYYDDNVKGPYECLMCHKWWPIKCALRLHVTTHTGENALECDICHKKYSRTSYLTEHMRTHTGEKRYECDICHKRFNRTNHLTRHNLTHIVNINKPFECLICRKFLKTKTALRLHTRRLHVKETRVKHNLKCHSSEIKSYECQLKFKRVDTQTREYDCLMCNKRFTQKQTLVRHMRIHNGEKPYKCEICNHSFCRNEHLVIHVRTHTGKKPYECYICHKRFNQSYHVKRHMRVHSGEKPYECEICHHNFGRKEGLSVHMQTHTGQKPYECSICQKRFTVQGNLTRHAQANTCQNTYECDICHKRFKDKTHMRTHTGVKPYVCDICHRSFNKNGNLKGHMRTHAGQKMPNLYDCDNHKSNTKCALEVHKRDGDCSGESYACDICHRRFTRKDSMTRHKCIHTRINFVNCEIDNLTFT